MDARYVIDSVSYGPEALKAIGQAYDAAWSEIAGNFGDDPRDIERARLTLANSLLSIACEESRDVEVLKNGALQAMALAYRSPRRANSGEFGCGAHIAPRVVEPTIWCLSRAAPAPARCRSPAFRRAQSL